MNIPLRILAASNRHEFMTRVPARPRPAPHTPIRILACLSAAISTAILLTGLTAAAQADPLDFSILPAAARMNEPAAEALSFRILGDEPRAATDGGGLDFTVVGVGRAMPGRGARRTVFVYSAGETDCPPCRRLKADFEAGLVPLDLEWRAPPTWVQGFPTLHWQDARGAWRQWAGWPGAQRFREILKAADQPQK